MTSQTKGYIMAIIGFIMIVIAALDYLLQWHQINSSFSVIGIVFVVIGTGFIKKQN